MSEFIPTHAMITSRGSIRPIRVDDIRRDGSVHYTGADGNQRTCGLGNLKSLEHYDRVMLQESRKAA